MPCEEKSENKQKKRPGWPIFKKVVYYFCIIKTQQLSITFAHLISKIFCDQYAFGK